MDYRKMYENQVGACASCRHVRDIKAVKDSRGITEKILVPYTGSKRAGCEKKGLASIVMNDTPRNELPVNTCWEPETEVK